MTSRAPSTAPRLEVSHVSLEFEGLRVLQDVSLAVEERTLAALVGPNGAGKTSLLNCVGGFYTPTRGTITFGGAALAGLRPDRIAGFGIARSFQFVELFRHMSVLDNLLLGRHLHMRSGVLAGAIHWGRSRSEAARQR